MLAPVDAGRLPPFPRSGRRRQYLAPGDRGRDRARRAPGLVDRLAPDRHPRRRDRRHPGRRVRRLPPLPERTLLMRTALFSTPRPVPGRLLPALGAALVI